MTETSRVVVEMDGEQFLRMCRRGGKVQIRKGSSQEEDIRTLFDALDLDGDKLVTIDEVVSFVWEEPLHETLDPLSSATSVPINCPEASN